MMAPAGVAILVTGLALLHVLQSARSQTAQRAECIDVSVAITVTAALPRVAMLAVAGIAGILFPNSRLGPPTDFHGEWQ